MRYSPAAAETVLKLVSDCIATGAPPDLKIRQVWWTMMYMRARTLANALRLVTGDRVNGGPFQGMLLTPEAVHMYLSPILLGTYEYELHPIFEKIISANYKHILNIGCSVGYYAVGLALRMPQMTIEAFDTDLDAQEKCGKLALLNNVQDRVHISGQFDGSSFEKYANEKTLVLMDIETAETTLLDPSKYPALQKMDIVVELHDLIDPKISKTVSNRFSSTHDVQIIQNRSQMPLLSGSLLGDQADDFDRFIMGWEGRDGPTPWGYYLANS